MARSRRDRVFPAYAGMSRTSTKSLVPYWGFPRLRGDEPVGELTVYEYNMFSPPTRG